VVDAEQPRKCYDATIEYTDRFLGKIFSQFQQAGLLDDTLFVIGAISLTALLTIPSRFLTLCSVSHSRFGAAGDHGEMFGEHGQFQHGSSLHEEALRVPLALLGPDIGPAGEPIAGLRSLVDVAPTVLEWLGAEVSNGMPLRTGKSLLQPGKYTRSLLLLVIHGPKLQH